MDGDVPARFIDCAGARGLGSPEGPAASGRLGELATARCGSSPGSPRPCRPWRPSSRPPTCRRPRGRFTSSASQMSRAGVAAWDRSWGESGRQAGQDLDGDGRRVRPARGRGPAGLRRLVQPGPLPGLARVQSGGDRLLDRAVALDAGPAFEPAVEAWTLAEVLRQGDGAEPLADDLRFACILDGIPERRRELLAEFPEIHRVPTVPRYLAWSPIRPRTSRSSSGSIGASRTPSEASLARAVRRPAGRPGEHLCQPIDSDTPAFQPARRDAPRRPRSACSPG